MQISFELSPSDVEYFRKLLHASTAGKAIDEAKVLAATEALLADVDATGVSGFIGQCMTSLRTMIAMLRDEEFALTAEFRTAVVTALAYFADPHDLIPDEVPGLGYLDDAIMVEIVRLELQAEIDAYDEFRASLGERRAVRTADPDAYTKFLEEKRAKLFEQLRERRGNFYDHG